MEEYLFNYYDTNGDKLRNSVKKVGNLDLSYLPKARQKALAQSYAKTLATFALMDQVRAAEAAREKYEPEYRPLHREVRRLQVEIRKIESEIEETE